MSDGDLVSSVRKKMYFSSAYQCVKEPEIVKVNKVWRLNKLQKSIEVNDQPKLIKKLKVSTWTPLEMNISNEYQHIEEPLSI